MDRAKKAFTGITRSSEYRRIYDNGRKLVGRYYVMFYGRTETGGARVGITVSGKVGGAVVRNRAKRRTRVALKLVFAGREISADIVFVALGRIVDAPFDGLVKDLSGLISRVEH